MKINEKQFCTNLIILQLRLNQFYLGEEEQQEMKFYLYQKDVVTIPPYITRGTEPKNKSAEQRRPRKNANQ